MDGKPLKPYPSDLSDAQWALLEPLLPPSVSAGASRTTQLCEDLNAIFNLLSTGSCRNVGWSNGHSHACQTLAV